MTVYPSNIDSDENISRIDDNITELGGQAINELRDAVFAIEEHLGILPAGSASTVADRLNKSLLPDGSISSTALNSAGLVTVPVVNSNVSSTANIAETKLALAYSTTSLKNEIDILSSQFTALNTFAHLTDTDLSDHYLGINNKHEASHILISPAITNLTATNSREAFIDITDKFYNHKNADPSITGVGAPDAIAHIASSITVDTSTLTEIPSTADNVQKVIEALDSFEVSNMGQHRATQHADGIPKVARSSSLVKKIGLGKYDMTGSGRGSVVVPMTIAKTFLREPSSGSLPSVNPYMGEVDDAAKGDNLISLTPAIFDSVFDSKCSQVKVGDIIRVDYKNGIETTFIIDSVRYKPGIEFVVRVNGINFAATEDADVTIEKPLYDRNTFGILSVAPSNYPVINPSLIVADPKSAAVLGLGFNPNQLDSTHYMLYLDIFPNGNPLDRVVHLPGIDVTGNAGATPGAYTLESVVLATNNAFRKAGYNYRFIAFSNNGEFGLSMADCIRGVSFSIVSGDISSGTIVPGTFVNNVIDATSTDDYDPLGLGILGANVASPSYTAPFDAQSAQTPTKVISPLQNRSYVVNGVRLDKFKHTYLANDDGSWDATLYDRELESGSGIVTATYAVNKDLSSAKLAKGKTLVVQPVIEFGTTGTFNYTDVDYGRFIIKDVVFDDACSPGVTCTTYIKVASAIHGTGLPTGFSTGPISPTGPFLDVKIFFSEDSVSFNNKNVIDPLDTSDYRRFHEIFINSVGETFSHERARFVSSISDLETNKWSIKNISPKLRGYSSSTFNLQKKSIQLFVDKIDIVTGDITAWLQDPLNPTVRGAATVSRKGSIVVYDETNVDFIEFVCSDYPAMSSSGKSFDIELFPSLQLDDELMLLATCDVLKDGSNLVVQNVIDRRSFGSIHSDDLSTSAKLFISAGDRLLHENGVIRGFDFVQANPSRIEELYFTGGTALVNGKILSVNNSEFNMPKLILSDITGIDTSKIKYCICVNDDGLLEGVFITDTKANVKIFGLPVNSFTFSELVNSVKRLTPLYLVNLPSSATVLDVRKFVYDSGKGIPLTVSSDGFVGNFKTFDSVVNWINSYGLDNTVVKVKGKFVIDSAIDLRSLSRFVIFEGDGCEITVNSDVGFYLGSNTHFKNVKFVYTKVSSITGYIDPYGCLSVLNSVNINNVKIDGCSFEYSVASANRKSFITFGLSGSAELIEDVNVVNCKFVDGNASRLQSAIAFYNNGSTKLLRNVNVENNICNSLQGIYLTKDFVMVNCNVKNNNCGYIGFWPSSNRALASDDGKPSRLNVSDNTCLYVGTSDDFGLNTNATKSIGGNINISKNYCSAIMIACSSAQIITSNISENNITSNNDAMLVYSGSSSVRRIGYVAINLQILSAGECYVSNNNISGTSVYKFQLGVFASCSSVISNNIISGVTKGSPPTSDELESYISINLLTVSGRTVNITNNKLIRGSAEELFAFIFVESNENNSGMIVDNIFSSPYIDIANTITSTINSHWTITSLPVPETFIVERNKNQTVVKQITSAVGQFGSSSSNLEVPLFLASDKIYISDSGSLSQISLYYNLDTTAAYFSWIIDLNSILPSNVNIIRCQITWEVQEYEYMKPLIVKISNYNSAVSDSLPFTPITNGDHTGSIGTSEFSPDITLTNKYYTSNKINGPVLSVLGGMDGINVSGSFQTFIKNVYVTYRY